MICVKTISAQSILLSNNPNHNNVIFHSDRGEILCDSLKLIPTDENVLYKNVLNERIIMIGGGIFLKPPYPYEHISPYLHSIKDDVYKQIKDRKPSNIQPC